MSEYKQLLDSALVVVGAHNETVGEDGKLDLEAFTSGLTKLGGTDETALREITAEDLVGLGLPILRARQVVRIFRKEESIDASAERGGMSRREAEQATARALVLAYDPARPTTRVADELTRRSKGAPFVLFDEQGGIHTKLTTQFLEELESGEEPRESYTLNGHPRLLYRVGERPPQMADEHPLFARQALRKDGSCRFGLNWRDGIKQETRVLLHLAVHHSRELQIAGPNIADLVHEIHARAKGDDAPEQLRSRYRLASLRYDELEASGNLPSLKILHGGRQTKAAGICGMSKTDDPFYGAGKLHKRF